MNRTRSLIISGCALLLNLMSAGQLTAKSPTPSPLRTIPTDLSRVFVTFVGGEARFVREAGSAGNGFTCGTPSFTSQTLNEVQVLKFSFGQPLTGAAFGSWRLRRLAAQRGITVICQGNFYRGSVNLTNRSSPELPARHFLLFGRVTNVDAYCFDPDVQRDIRITGRCGPSSEVTLALLEGNRTVARGTFRSNTDILCDRRLASDVDRTLSRD